jgi:hypothetical protein
VPVDHPALSELPGDWSAGDSTGSLGGTATCDLLWVSEQEQHMAEQVANLRRQIEVATTNKRRRMRARSKRRP